MWSWLNFSKDLVSDIEIVKSDLEAAKADLLAVQATVTQLTNGALTTTTELALLRAAFAAAGIQIPAMLSKI